MIYYIISSLLLFLLGAIAIAYIITMFTKERHERIEFIRNFKKGNCAIVYVAVLPLYLLGHIYAGDRLIPSIFTSVNETMGLIVMEFTTDSVSALMAVNAIYKISMQFAFVLVTVNAFVFALSLFQQKVWEWFFEKRWNSLKKDRLLIVGNNAENLKIYSSEKKRTSAILDDISGDDKASFYANKINFISKGGDGIEKFSCNMLEKFIAKPKKTCMLVINTGDDKKNIALCRSLVEGAKNFFCDKSPEELSSALERVKIYVFGEPSHETIYRSLVEASHGCVHYVNKYRQIATDFIDRYPLTQFMTDAQMDFDTSLLRDGVEVNMAFVGFGKTNEQIFLTSVANNQFLTLREGEKVLKPVNYYIFDKEHLDNDKNLNHSYYRFKNEFKASGRAEDEYLPLPDFASREYYDKLDINDASFYEKLRKALSGKGKYNYVVISFGPDLENVDMAHKIIEKKAEWGLDNTYIFVRVRSGDSAYEIFSRDDCFVIGDEDRAVYDIERIDSDEITAMAKMRNKIYSLEYEMTVADDASSVDAERVYAQANCDWYVRKTEFERESNIYACLSLRPKLQMMGLDYRKKSGDGLSAEEYMSRYASGDEVEYYDGLVVDGKKVVKYSLDFKNSRRQTMAIQEHYRWNSFMISKGFVPASKEEILADKKKNGKNYALRRHGNLTTFDGLVEFRKMVAERDGKDELATDVIKYDYQLLDDAFWLLEKSGYEITKKAVI